MNFWLNTGPERTMWQICLPSVWGPKDFLRHRTSLGFETPEVPMQDLHRVRDVMLINSKVDHKQDVAFVEVCCGD